MLLTKICNSSALFWDTLDSRERMILVYAGAWVMLVGALSMQRRSRERFRQSVIDELAGARG